MAFIDQIKMASECEMSASLALISNEKKGNMGREEDYGVSDGEASLQSCSGEDFDEVDLQPPPRSRPTSTMKKGASSCKRRVNDILKDMNRAINEDEEELHTLSITATTESSHKKAGNVSEVRKPCKSGRKAAWSEDLLQDLVDCITGDEEFTKKLIFTNIPNGKNALVYAKVIKKVTAQREERGESFDFTIDQTRNKFKKLIAICKSAALTIKSSSGIKRFQDEHEYGVWFTRLFPLVKSRDSSQPDQAIEPSTSSSNGKQKDDAGENADQDIKQLNEKVEEKDLFVPTRNGKQPRKRKSDKGQSVEILEGLKDIMKERDTTTQMIDFFKRENKAAREHELQLFKIMFSSPQSQQQHCDGFYGNDAAINTAEMAGSYSSNPSSSRQFFAPSFQSTPKRTTGSDFQMEGFGIPTSSLWRASNQKYEYSPYERNMNINENPESGEKQYFNL